MGIDLVVTPQEVWRFGTQERVARGAPVVLVGGVTAAAGARRYSTLRALRAGAGYQVTAGRTLLITRVLFYVSTGGLDWYLVDGTDDVGVDSAAAPAGPVIIDSIVTAARNVLSGLGANTLYDVNYYVSIPGGRFLAVSVTTANDRVAVYAQGVEV